MIAKLDELIFDLFKPLNFFSRSESEVSICTILSSFQNEEINVASLWAVASNFLQGEASHLPCTHLADP